MTSAQATIVAASPADDAAISARKPSARSNGVVTGLIAKLPTNTHMTINPAWTGLQPKPSCSSSGSRNGTELTATR